MQIRMGAAGNWMGDKLDTGFSSGPTALPFLKCGFLNYRSQAFGIMIGNSVQSATENLTTERKRSRD